MNRNLKPIEDDFIISCQNNRKQKKDESFFLPLVISILVMFFLTLIIASWQTTRINLLQQNVDYLMEQDAGN